MQSPISPTRLNRKLIYDKIFLEVLIFLLIIFALFISFLVLKENKKESLNKYSSIAKDAQFVPDQIIVKFKKGSSPFDLEKQIKERNEKKKNVLGKLLIIIEDAGYSLKKEEDPEIRLLDLRLKLEEVGVLSWEKVYKETEDPVLKRYYLLKLKKGTSVEKTYEELTAFYEIENLQPNYIITIQETPNDPSYQSQWGLKKIDLENAWNITKGSNTVIVAVLDTGIDYNHEDLPSDIIRGRNFAYGNDNPMDDMWHGTHVAGTIGELTNNGKGGSGVNWNVKLMAVKVMGADGRGPSTAVYQGIEYAANNGAKVINMSLGDRSNPCDTFYQDVINNAINKGVVIVVAAGNESQNVMNTSPGSCNGVIAVGASTSGDSRASFSNWGQRVDIAAPGTVILSTSIGGYKTAQGTSMASPHVAGAAALLLSACPNLSVQQVRDYLVDNGDPITTDLPIGGKRLNVYKAINTCTGGAPPPTNSPTMSPTATPTTTLTPVPTTEQSVTPTLTLTPTSAITPTMTISPTGGNQPLPSEEPTPTPIPYTCVPDPDCVNKSGQSNIQLCPLKCTPM